MSKSSDILQGGPLKLIRKVEEISDTERKHPGGIYSRLVLLRKLRDWEKHCHYANEQVQAIRHDLLNDSMIASPSCLLDAFEDTRRAHDYAQEAMSEAARVLNSTIETEE